MFFRRRASVSTTSPLPVEPLAWLAPYRGSAKGEAVADNFAEAKELLRRIEYVIGARAPNGDSPEMRGLVGRLLRFKHDR